MDERVGEQTAGPERRRRRRPIVIDRDVAVVGAGPAGSAVAIRLVRSGYSVALFEAGHFDKPKVGESLTPSVRPLLRDLDVWNDLLATNPLPSWGTVSIWSSPELERHSHLTSPHGRGWHVDRRAFDEALALAAQRRGADLLLGTRMSGARYRSGRWLIDLDGAAEQASARILVDASGRSGRVGRMLGARRMVFDHLVAVGRTWRAGGSEIDRCVVVEAIPEGWWYSAPLPDGGLITLLMTDADICRTQQLTNEEVWARTLVNAGTTATRCRGLAPVGRIRSHTACSGRMLRSDGDPWLAAGDAALAVDPLTGGGVARALRSAEAVASAVIELLGVNLGTGTGDGPACGPSFGRVDTERRRIASIIGAYEQERNRDCHRYLHERLDFYTAGPTWDSPFWARRHRAGDRRNRTARLVPPG